MYWSDGGSKSPGKIVVQTGDACIGILGDA